jgi:exonuclease III
MKVGSWNVRTMLQAGKMAEIADELLKYDLDITALQEIRWKGYGKSRNQDILYYIVEQRDKANKVSDS